MLVRLVAHRKSQQLPCFTHTQILVVAVDSAPTTTGVLVPQAVRVVVVVGVFGTAHRLVALHCFQVRMVAMQVQRQVAQTVVVVVVRVVRHQVLLVAQDYNLLSQALQLIILMAAQVQVVLMVLVALRLGVVLLLVSLPLTLELLLLGGRYDSKLCKDWSQD